MPAPDNVVPSRRQASSAPAFRLAVPLPGTPPEPGAALAPGRKARPPGAPTGGTEPPRPGPGVGPAGGTQGPPGAEAEPETKPIPAVRTRSMPPRKHLLIAASFAGGVLITVPLVLAGGGQAPDPHAVGDPAQPVPIATGSSPSPTSAQTLSPGAFPLATATASASGPPVLPGGALPSPGPDESPNSPEPTSAAPAPVAWQSPTPSARTASAAKPAQKSSSTKAATTAKPTTHIEGYGSNRCVDVSDHQPGTSPDGSPLQLWDCASRDDESWTLEPDGTIQSMGMCMDVAWGSTSDGAVVQLARCSGNPAQQWVLTPGADLVNPQANKCLDAVNKGTGNGTRLQIWDCSGTSNQKWHTVTT